MDEEHLREPSDDMPVDGAVMTAALLRGALVGMAMLGMSVAPAVAEPVLCPDLTDRVCAYERTQQLDIRQDAGQTGLELMAVVSELVSATGENCGDTAVPEPGTRTITYHWDDGAQRYVPGSDAFDVLAHENEAQF